MSNKVKITIVVSLIIAVTLFLFSILFRNLYFGLGGAGMLLASLLFFSSVPSS